MEILLFKTSVTSVESVSRLTPLLNKLAGKDRWNFALDDCDRILRITAGHVRPGQAVQVLTEAGYACEELE